MKKKNTDLLFDDYLNGLLLEKEKKTLEEKLKIDVDFAKSFEKHKEIIGKLKDYYRIKDVKMNLMKISKERRKRRISNRYAIISIAASWILVVVFTGLIYVKFSNKVESELYIELKDVKDDIDNINDSQKSIWHFLSDNKKKIKGKNYRGTCFAISNNGYFVTSYHLVKDAKEILIKENTNDGTTSYLTANIVHSKPLQDIAILFLNNDSIQTEQLPYSIYEQKAELGEEVYTLGFSKKDIVFGEGNISSLSGYKSDTSSYQISIPLNTGNSGGPLVNNNGSVIGIISGKEIGKENVAFAIKSDYILHSLQELNKDSMIVNYKTTNHNTIENKTKIEQIKLISSCVYKIIAKH